MLAVASSNLRCFAAITEMIERDVWAFSAAGSGDAPLVISFPPDGARVEVSGGEPDAALALKAMGGAPPFTWLADGLPIVIGEERREAVWDKPGKGFARLSVIDARGHTASVQIRLD